jgi:[acyl-carrier-protein] S-malonyltransferase
MEAARAELQAAIEEVEFHTPRCPIYQNVDAQPHTSPDEIKQNLIAQLTAPVRWTQIVKNMLADGVMCFDELGPGNVLQGLIKKVSADVQVESRADVE